MAEQTEQTEQAWSTRKWDMAHSYTVTPIGSDGKQYWESRMYPSWVAEGPEYFAVWCAQDQLGRVSGDVRIVACLVTEYADDSLEQITNIAWYNAETFKNRPLARPARY